MIGAKSTDPILLAVGFPIGLVEVPANRAEDVPEASTLSPRKRGIVGFRGERIVLAESGYFLWLHALPGPTSSALLERAHEIAGAAGPDQVRELEEAGLVQTYRAGADGGGLDLWRLTTYPLGTGLGRAGTAAVDFVIGDLRCEPVLRLDQLGYLIWCDLSPGEPLERCAERASARFGLTTDEGRRRIASLLVALMRSRLIALDGVGEMAPPSAPAPSRIKIKTRRTAE